MAVEVYYFCVSNYMSRQNQIKFLRLTRKIHKWMGLFLALFLLISAITGITLAWKKNIATLQPPTVKGVSTDLSTWKPMAELHDLALVEIKNHLPKGETAEIDRIDARPSKGMVKVLFNKGWWEVQLDATTGKTLSVGRRHADWIEHLHDGSIVNQLFKLVSMNTLGIGLIISVLGGFWLWFAPRKLRRERND